MNIFCGISLVGLSLKNKIIIIIFNVRDGRYRGLKGGANIAGMAVGKSASMKHLSFEP